MNSAAIYPGSFDPMTLGHLDVVERAARIFPRVVVAVARAAHKRTMFDAGERTQIVREVVRGIQGVEVEPFDGLLVAYARRKGIHVVIRGLRAFSDFEFEFQMALTNRKMAPELETLFLMPKEEYSYISSSTVREIAELSGDVSRFAPAASAAALQRKLARTGAAAPPEGDVSAVDPEPMGRP